MKSKFMLIMIFFALFGCEVDRGGVNVWDGRTTMHMPFTSGTKWMCTQGTESAFSHKGRSTKYDLDFDTPNAPNALAELYAPLAGTAYVHNDVTGFGKHVNIDLGDGTYIVIGHMNQIYVSNGTFVQMGMLLGLAGCTGNCTGEHVHIGVHRGDATRFAGAGESIPSNMFNRDQTVDPFGPAVPRSGPSHNCGIPGGHRYESQLPYYTGASSSAPPNTSGGSAGNGGSGSSGNSGSGSGSNGGSGNTNTDDGLVEFCWDVGGLNDVRNAELWVLMDGDWEVIDASSGAFTQLCAEIPGTSGMSIIVNGEYDASNTPGSPWWICAHTSATTSQVYGAFLFDGRQVGYNIQDWGGGCDVRLTIP